VLIELSRRFHAFGLLKEVLERRVRESGSSINDNFELFLKFSPLRFEKRVGPPVLKAAGATEQCLVLRRSWASLS